MLSARDLPGDQFILSRSGRSYNMLHAITYGKRCATSRSGFLVLAVRLVSSKAPKGDQTQFRDLTNVATHKRRLSSSYTTKPEKIMDKKIDILDDNNSASRFVPSESSPSANKRAFVPVERFPKAPEHIINMSTDDLYSQHNIQFGTPPPKEKDKDKYVDFVIPDRYLKSVRSKQITPKDKAMVEELENLIKTNDEYQIAQSQYNLIKLYYDQDSDSYQPMPEHALKKSLSGMINLNPSMDDIEDDYLWQLFPKGSLFGVPPFEKDAASHSFKQWEHEMLQKQKKTDVQKQHDLQEYNEFRVLLSDSKSFFRKTSNSNRKKLDRKLLKEYKKMKTKGKLPKDDDDDEPL